MLSDYVKLKIGEAGQSILDGDIRPEPHMRSEKDISPCTYCEYHGICGYRGRGSVYGDELPEEQAADGYETDTNGDPAPSASGYPSDAGGGQNEDIIAAMRDYIKHKRQNDGEDND